jgi:hypothetical protein
MSKSHSKHKNLQQHGGQWQHYGDQQECFFTAQRIKLNTAAKGKD